MKKIITTYQRVGIALFLLILCNVYTVASGCDPYCGISNPGTISGPTSICAGQSTTYTFSGATCSYSGCTIQRRIKVYQGSTLVYASTLSTSTTHTFTPQNSGTYTVYGFLKSSYSSTYCQTESICLTAKVTPGTPTGACGSISACVNESFTLSATPASGSVLKWYDGTTLIGTGNSISHSETTIGNYTYKAYSYNTTSGCTSTNGLSVNATVNSIPTNLVINSASYGNVGQAITISGSASGSYLTYSWNFGSGASPSTGNGTGPFYVTYSSLGSKTVTLTVTSGNGCETTITKTIKICGIASINCVSNTCTNTNLEFSADNAGTNSTYAWNFGSGATPTTANGIGPHNVSYSTAGSKTVTLTVGNSAISGCSDIDTRNVTITESPSASISGATTGNINTNYTFTTSAVTGATYSWNIPSDAVIVSGSGTNSVIVKWPTAGSKTFSVTVSKNGCSATDNHCIVISSCPDAIINSVSDICKSDPQTFSTVNQGTGVTYNWNFGSGASPATASTIGPHSVNYSTTGSKTATLTVYKSGCTNKTTSVTFNVNASLGTVTLTPPSFTIFEDTALTYTATAITGATYSWSATGGATITGSGNSVQILFPTAGDQTITVIASKNGCSTTTELDITVKTPICTGIKFDFTGVPLKTNMKNYTYTDITGNWVKLYKPSNSNDSFHTSRKFQRNKDTAITWQEMCGTVGKSTIKFNRSASDLRFSIRDLEKNSLGQEIITVSAYYKGSLVNTSDIDASFNSYKVDDFNNTGTSISYRGLTSAYNSSSYNDIAFHFESKVDSVALVLTNTNTSGGASGDYTSTSSDGKYKVELVDAGTYTGNNKYTWTWKFTNINPGSSSPSISHWDLGIDNCAILAGVLDDMVSVQYSTNGTSWNTLSDCKYDYDYDQSMKCDNIKVLKLDQGTNGSVIYYRIVLNRAYDVDFSATSFYKAGSSCGEMTIAGIGCPTTNCLSDIGISKMTFCITEPLPVTWLSVTALKNDKGGVDVNWATATEINNDHFSVEKSSDNRNFTEITQVKGAGNKNTISKYSIEDNSPATGTVYYRIKQVDYNGEFAYSAVASVTPGKLLANVTMNPNPATSNVTLTWDAGIKEQLTLNISNISGVVIISEPLPPDSNIHYLNLENINNGLYLINILSTKDVVYRSRLVIAK